MSRKIISFSLWGDNPKYCVGALKNAELASIIYPGWVCRFYVGKSTPLQYINKLTSFKNTEVYIMKEQGNWLSMFWRFLAIDDTAADIIIIRDTDSRLNYREKSAVDEWLNSDKAYHIMRDHPYHGNVMLGGMWGARKPVLINFYNEINKYLLKDAYNIDQDFLANIVYPSIKNNVIVHDEFFSNNKFPTKRNGLEFVGQVFMEDDTTVVEHVEILNKHINKII